MFWEPREGRTVMREREILRLSLGHPELKVNTLERSPQSKTHHPSRQERGIRGADLQRALGAVVIRQGLATTLQN